MPDATYPLAFFGTALPNGFQRVKYSAQIVAGGGRPTYAYAVQTGSLPDGLMLHSDGLISGKPKVSGTFSVTFEVTDSSTPVPQTATQTMSLTIAARN